MQTQSTTIGTPQFTHDCESCVFLEHSHGHDWIVCKAGGHNRVLGYSYLARFGNEGPEYWSSQTTQVSKNPEGQVWDGNAKVCSLFHRHAFEVLQRHGLVDGVRDEFHENNTYVF